MACVFKISKENIEDPMKWFDENVDGEGHDGLWEKDDILNQYHKDEVYFTVHDEFLEYDDFNNEKFYGWETEAWLELAQDNELIYGYYSDDDLEAEFIHIMNGKCVREFRQYEEIEVDEGQVPEFDDWVDVATYVDEEFL